MLKTLCKLSELRENLPQDISYKPQDLKKSSEDYPHHPMLLSQLIAIVALGHLPPQR